MVERAKDTAHMRVWHQGTRMVDLAAVQVHLLRGMVACSDLKEHWGSLLAQPQDSLHRMGCRLESGKIGYRRCSRMPFCVM